MTNWLLDLDDCLATGHITWALRHAFPALISDHQLPHDLQVFNQAILHAQMQSNVLPESEAQKIIDELFDALGWPRHLEGPLLETIYTKYQPELFDDVVPFLESLQNEQHRVYLVSNNKHAEYLAKMLNIDHYFAELVTPGERQPKPSPDLWEYLISQHPEINTTNAVFVGDDPWTDGKFAETCQIRCYLLDRENRFGTLTLPTTTSIAGSLLDIPTS